MENILGQMTLLYVEDSLSIRQILMKRLEKKVKQLYVASDGEEGLKSFLTYRPDIILTDITMPKVDGIEMIRRIKEIDESVATIILSGHTDASCLLDAIDLGVSGYLLKPIDREKMFLELEKQAKHVSLHRINRLQQEKIYQQQLLQNIMDQDKNINFVTNFDEISFANASFLKFFQLKNIDDFKKKFSMIEDIFIKHHDYIYPSMSLPDKKCTNELIAESFYKNIQKIDESKRVVLILDKNFELKSFFINISVIDDQQHVYLISLTDITKMRIEKVGIEYKAYYDNLTGVYSRNKLDEFFEQEILRIKRYNHPLCAAVIDIDNFKRINDTYGHLVGDEVLIMLAQNVQNKIRNTDMFARWGGEEFVIVFTETDIEGARKTADNIRSYIQTLHHKIIGNITVSMGVSKFRDTDTEESFFKRCDDALYHAKRNGKNRVEVK